MQRAFSGFSLIEVIVAIGIIGLLIASTGTFIQRIPVSGRDTRDQDLALRVARSGLETVRAGGYALATSSPFTSPLLPLLASSTAHTTVSAYSAKTKRVDVRVTWVSAGAPRTLTLTTLMTDYAGLP